MEEIQSTNECKICWSEVTTGVNCIECGMLIHDQCADALGVNNCCFITGGADLQEPVSPAADDLQEQASPSESDQLTTEIRYLRRLIQEKDCVINNLNHTINVLEDRVSLQSELIKVKETNTQQSKKINNNQKQSGLTYKANTAFDASSSKSNNANTKTGKNFTAEEVMKLLTLHGPSKEVSKIPKAVPTVSKQTFWVFATKFIRSYTESNLMDYLVAKFPSADISVQMVPTRFQWNSFKVGIDRDFEREILRKEVWPPGIEVSCYRFYKK